MVTGFDLVQFNGVQPAVSRHATITGALRAVRSPRWLIRDNAAGVYVLQSAQARIVPHSYKGVFDELVAQPRFMA